MPHKHKKKVQAANEDLKIEIITRVEVIYEDTKAVTGIEPEYKWGEIYQMITNISVLDKGLEYLPIYSNIERSAIIKVSTCPKNFPCLKVIGWILPRAYVTKMILANTKGKGYAAYIPSYVAQAYKLPMPETYLTKK